MNKRSKITREEYIATYCRDKRIRNRWVVYVSDEVHLRLQKLAFYLRDEHVTITSLADTIIRSHLDQHEAVFKELEQEYFSISPIELLRKNLNKKK